MKIKLDENIPIGLLGVLSGLGHDVDTVPSEGLTGKEDRKVLSATQDASRFFVTQDLDFSNIHDFKPGSHRGLLLIRLRNPGRMAIIKKMGVIFSQEQVENGNLVGIDIDHASKIVNLYKLE